MIPDPFVRKQRLKLAFAKALLDDLPNLTSLEQAVKSLLETDPYVQSQLFNSSIKTHPLFGDLNENIETMAP